MPGMHGLDAAARTLHRGSAMPRRTHSMKLLTRRDAVLGAVAGTVAGFADAASGTPVFSLALIGQCLIREDLRASLWPGFAPLARQLRRNHACFSDLEVALLGARAGAPTRKLDTVHTADPIVLDCLRDFGVSFLATSNNHAFDVGTGGILDTMDALRARGLAFAGTGMTLDEAAAPGFQDTAAGRLAVVAAAAGMIREGGAATHSRAGVHELRGRAGEGLQADDVERMLASIRTASSGARIVLAYLHNHLWEPDIASTADWQRDLARRCIDAGANVFVAHGPPLLHGIEMYRGAPLFHGLGSFIFQTRKPPDAYGEANWQSLIAECRFDGRRFTSARLTPVQLAREGRGGVTDFATRGRPSPATPTQARAILTRVGALSSALGYRLGTRGTTARIGPD